MKKAHAFNFDGGMELSHMGATWFVSYAYHCSVNKKHVAWENVKTYSTRISVFNRTKKYHVFWLQQVLLMEDARLSTNKLGVEAKDVKNMARETLDKYLRE